MVLADIGFIKKEQDFSTKEERMKLAVGDNEERPHMRSCPKCGAPTLIRQEGCDSCISCGYSKCG